MRRAWSGSWEMGTRGGWDLGEDLGKDLGGVWGGGLDKKWSDGIGPSRTPMCRLLLFNPSHFIPSLNPSFQPSAN